MPGGGRVMAMVRLGILGCDTSHVVEFTRRLHGVDVPPEQHVHGARVVAAWPGPPSEIAPQRVPGYVEALRRMGVAIVDGPQDLMQHGVDAVLVEAQEGRLHAPLALPWLRAGIAVFVDKPFACSVADAAAMTEAAARTVTPLLSASSLRYAEEVLALDCGPIQGAQTHSPASLHPANPGLFHYGVHGVEMLYAVMGGPGCRSVRCVSQDGADGVLGVWADGRLGSVRGLRHGHGGYGFTAFGTDGTVTARIDTAFIYRNLLRVIVGVLSRRVTSQLSPEELVEAVAFQDAARRSAEMDGDAVAVPTI